LLSNTKNMLINNCIKHLTFSILFMLAFANANTYANASVFTAKTEIGKGLHLNKKDTHLSATNFNFCAEEEDEREDDELITKHAVVSTVAKFVVCYSHHSRITKINRYKVFAPVTLNLPIYLKIRNLRI
jgi:hypothetical protein